MQQCPEDETSEPKANQSVMELAIDQVNTFNPKDTGEWPQVLTDHNQQHIVKFGWNTDIKLKEMLRNDLWMLKVMHQMDVRRHQEIGS